MTLFHAVSAFGLAAFIASAVLAAMLRRRLPGLHSDVGSPVGVERSPFWVLHFLSPRRWRELPVRWKPLAGLAVTMHLISILSLFTLLFWFAASGREL